MDRISVGVVATGLTLACGNAVAQAGWPAQPTPTRGGARAVIQAAIEHAGWLRWMPAEGRGHGVAFARFKNCDAWCAVVAEVEVEREVRVVRVHDLPLTPERIVEAIARG